jgi:D-cysteine desulfhydrase
MEELAVDLATRDRKGYVIPGGGSNALGGLGYVACAQEMQAQWFDMGLRFERVLVGSGSSGTHGGLVAGFVGNRIDVPIVGVGVSRDAEQQEPLVLKEAQAVVDLLGLDVRIPHEAVQMMARTEGIPLDPVYTGKIMAGLIGLARAGEFAPGERVLFIHTGGLPSLYAYEGVVLGEGTAVAP